MSAKEHHCANLYEYVVNGKTYKRIELINLLLDRLEVKAMSMEELSAETGISEQYMITLFRVMRDRNLIVNTKLRRNNHYLYKAHNDCLLAKYLQPSPADIESKFKINHRIVRKAEQNVSQSSHTNRNNFAYTSSSLNSIYWGD